MISLVAQLLTMVGDDSPIEFGKREIALVAREKASKVTVKVKPSATKEAFTITPNGSKVTIVGSDANGAMYGAMEFAERLRTQGKSAWTTKVSQKPYLADRGLNLFLTLPWNYQKNDTDYDPNALTDPNRWWFQNQDYWSTLLDMMAKSRLNWLDIHGTWDISVTNAPNLYAYFVTSKSFPKVGVSEEIKATNLRQLNHVVEMAHARGIRVSLMAYEANLKIPQNPNPPYQATEANIYTYTKEVVEQMVRGVPGLDAIGYRIGESGHSEGFFRCYGEAVKNSGRDIPIVTRSWITRRQKVLPLARASKDFTVEIKYNGEQWGAPYMVAGGRMASWHSYSFEDYLSDAGNHESDAKTWLGNPTTNGEHWPSNPYKIVWQVRANGTNRIFPTYNPGLVRSTIQQMKIGTASGYTIEGEDAYYPKSPDYYLANPKDKYCDWIHQRDEIYWMTWGRLGYDPNVSDSVFVDKMRQWFGDQAPSIANGWENYSRIVPLIFMSHALGPDHRDHAPELETGGNTQDFISAEPFDPFVFRSIQEDVAYKALGLDDGRIKPQIVAEDLISLANGDLLTDGSKRSNELISACRELGFLGTYFANRIKSAYAVAENDRLSGVLAQDSWALSKFDSAISFWESMTNSESGRFYKPFTEKLRMHTNTFSWADQDALLKKYRNELATFPPASNKVAWNNGPESLYRGNYTLKTSYSGSKLICKLVKSHKFDGDRWRTIGSASLLYKRLPSSSFFHKIPMKASGQGFVAELPASKAGYCIAAEYSYDNEGNYGTLRTPGITKDIFGKQFQAPYIIIPARPGPTPQIYSTQEAMTYLDPKSLNPEKHGMMLIAPRAWQFFNGFDNSTKRKLLDPVERGMKLMVMQQDFVSGRYKLDWLPKTLKAEANPNPNLFDAGGAFGIGKIEASEVMWQHFVESPGWEILGNGSFAHMKYGKGDIWVCAGRLMQRMTNAPCAKALRSIILSNGHEKPCVLIDPGTETAAFTTSFFPDFMNALNVPFLTLGEVIAKEQGMNEYRPIHGPLMDDDVLEGRGKQIANTFLRNQVIQAAKRTPPTTIAAFEIERNRRRKELMRSLGLEPLPERTPLNVRQTGTIQRNGYHIEKIVYESRPRFYVTAHVYKPDGVAGKLPVIVNVNGHWAHKKDEDRLQLRSSFQALQGYIAITIDSPGWSFEGNSLIERREEGTHNDFALVEGGTNATGYYVWDTMRGLDYMASRPDTDMSRVGITGASGGGLATLYTFAADDRYKAAVPVVYMSSMELAPDNGCLCNHVPATCQVGDRSDVIGIQAPKPVYVFGAQNDGEFPPAAMRLTHEKMAKEWALFGKGEDAQVRIFDGPHDYNQKMREQMIGFFNKTLKGEGDGSPVPEPHIDVIDPEDHQLLVLDPPPTNERTMRDLSLEYLAKAPEKVSAEDAIKVNGGRPAKSDLKLKMTEAKDKSTFTFESEPGLVTPGILVLPKGPIKRVVIACSDKGKASLSPIHDVMSEGKAGSAVFADMDTAVIFIDILGTGELSDIELRYPTYMGKSVPFYGGWQIVRAAEIARKYSPNISIQGTGPISSQAVMWAALLDPRFNEVRSYGQLRTWADAFKPGVPEAAIQPRAHLCGSLENLRKLAKIDEDLGLNP